MGKDETLELGALEADSIIEDAEDAASEAE